MENPKSDSSSDCGCGQPPTPQSLIIPTNVFDDIGLDPRAAEKLKILVADLNQHVAKLSQVAVENPDGTVRDGFSDEFSGLERESTVDFYTGDRSSARKVYNRNKNRYTNVLPYEDTRVVLDYNPCVGADYINANYVDGEVPGSERAYIATQGPLASTVVDFWRMVWQTGCRIIVMLTRLKEHDRLTSMTKVKCERYYPRNRPDENVVNFNGFRITLLEKEYAQLKQAPGQHNLVRRKLLLEETKSGEQRIVHHFQYTEWPDHGLPAAGTLGFRELLHMVDAVNGTDYAPKPPIVVHCSAGIGRTGTFCTVHSVLRKLHYTLKTHPDSPPFGVTQLIFDTVLRLRKQRFGMVQTKDQFMFCYKCLAEALEEEQRRHDELETVKKEKNASVVPAAAAAAANSSPSPSSSSSSSDSAKKQKSDS